MTLRSRQLRGFVLALLLFGPVIGANFLARSQLELLYPHLANEGLLPGLAVEAKLMLLERAGCPQVLTLGSSLTSHSLAPEYVRGRSLLFDSKSRPIETFFSFGIKGARAVLLYGIWRHVRVQGCVPDYVFVEVSPTILAEHAMNAPMYAAILGLETLSKLPDGTLAYLGLQPINFIDNATLQRLFVYRRRVVVRAAVAELFALTPPQLRQPLPLDGAIKPPRENDLGESRGLRERKLRTRDAATGQYDRTVSALEIEALRRLIVDIREAGSRVVLHTPPLSDIYSDVVDDAPGNDNFREMRTKIETALAKDLPEPHSAELDWYWCYGGDYQPTDFADWVHMNKTGGRRYASNLLKAVQSGRAEHARCDARQPR